LTQKKSKKQAEAHPKKSFYPKRQKLTFFSTFAGVKSSFSPGRLLFKGVKSTSTPKGEKNRIGPNKSAQKSRVPSLFG
jgi:hypothetical protein